MNQLNGDARLQDAKNKAIQSINKALADKLNDIDTLDIVCISNFIISTF
jgi:hypothetical protein